MTDIHKNILRILLIALAITAAAGVLSILMENEIMGRVTGTGFFAVLSAMIMLKISTSLENEKLRSASLFGLGVVAVEFLLILAMIWADVVGFDDHWRLLSTFFVVLFWSLFTALAIRGTAMEFSRLAGRVGLGFAGFTLLAAMIGIWIAGNSNDEWAGTAGVLATLGLAISGCCVGLGVRDESLPKRHWRWIGIVAGAAGIVISLYAIWADQQFWSETTAGKIAGLAGIIALYTGFANACMLTPLKPNQRWLLHGTLGTALVLAGLLVLLIFDGDDALIRYAGATAIPTACGAIALAVVARLNKRVEFEVASHDYLLIHLTCPRCRAPQQVPPGKSQCSRCQLKFDIKVEEPKCPNCDYLLYMLEGNDCPECGTAITTRVGPPRTTPTPVPSIPSSPTGISLDDEADHHSG